jgi:monofunctional biosynthetic peptidoglycan transglycosylase
LTTRFTKPRFLIWAFLALAIVWFVPWVFVFYTGVVVYFPYEPGAKGRYVRATGPLVKMVYPDSTWVSGDEINRACRRALVAAEDAKFYEHHGIDLDSIETAMKRNQRRGRIRWGGSTITQQLVKNVFLSRTKSYVRKARESVGALLLDLVMSKHTQITWYLNVVEFGPNTYGIGAAARRYYKKKAKDLTLSQCVNLVSILPYPNKTYRALEGGNVPRHLQARRDKIMRLLGY